MPEQHIEVASDAPPRFVHLGHDNAFLAAFSDYMESVAPKRSDYIIVASSAGMNHPPSGRVKTVVTTEAEAQAALLSSLDEYDVLVVHSMVRSWAQILPEAHRHLRTVWSGFGGDYYGSTRSPDDGLLGPQTDRLKRRLESRITLSERFDKVWFRSIDRRTFRRAARATDFFSAPVSTDLTVFRRRFPSFRGEFVQLNYATAEESSPPSTAPTGDNVLVGNSASYANNHLEVFETLAAAGIDGRELIVPLSYGEPVEYREAVMSAGAKHFGSAFVPLLEKVPLDEYTRLLSSCSHFVMGHRRQQALGNVISGLMGGSALVLDPRNPIHEFLEAQGAHVGSLMRLSDTGLEGLTLGEEEQEQNRQIARQVWGRAAVLENLRVFIDRVVP